MTHRALLLVLLFSSPVFSQQPVMQPQVRAANVIQRMSDGGSVGPNELIIGMPAAAPAIIGDTYFNHEWNLATITLFKTGVILAEIPARYDLATESVEIYTPEQIKMLGHSRIKSMELIDSLTHRKHTFINTKGIEFPNGQVDGLIEVILPGEVMLLKKTSLRLKKSTYTPGLDVGTKDHRIEKKVSYFAVSGKKASALSKKNDRISFFATHYWHVQDFVKRNRLSYKVETDLKQILNYYAGLRAGK